jgi:polyisoprenoid-binding protein YceI
MQISRPPGCFVKQAGYYVTKPSMPTVVFVSGKVSFVSISDICFPGMVFLNSKSLFIQKNACMKKLIYPFAATLLIIASAFTAFKSQDWKIADGYSVKFDGGDPSGQFGGLKGTISFDPNDLANSKFDATIEVATINTGNGMKNTHAKSAKWFDAEKYPVIQFTSSAITKSANGFDAKGLLSMHGVQKEVVIPFTFESDVFKSSFTVNRMDYNINTAEPDHGGAQFKVEITVPVTK